MRLPLSPGHEVKRREKTAPWMAPLGRTASHI